MRRRINVRSPLAHVREEFREKTGAHRVRPLVVPTNRLARFIREPRPTRNPRRKRMRKIDKFLRGDLFLDSPKLFGASRERCPTDYESKNPNEYGVEFFVHLHVLKHLRAM